MLRFLSTPSARRATRQKRPRPSTSVHFYPRPPRGGRPCRLVHLFRAASISIHALREEGDLIQIDRDEVACVISIHALREEGDLPRVVWTHQGRDFYPRPPRGGRRLILHGADVVQAISIHALREEGDAYVRANQMSEFHFYPRPPRGGRLSYFIKKVKSFLFLSTPSARRATL